MKNIPFFLLMFFMVCGCTRKSNDWVAKSSGVNGKWTYSLNQKDIPALTVLDSGSPKGCQLHCPEIDGVMCFILEDETGAKIVDLRLVDDWFLGNVQNSPERLPSGSIVTLEK